MRPLKLAPARRWAGAVELRRGRRRRGAGAVGSGGARGVGVVWVGQGMGPRTDGAFLRAVRHLTGRGEPEARGKEE